MNSGSKNLNGIGRLRDGGDNFVFSTVAFTNEAVIPPQQI